MNETNKFFIQKHNTPYPHYDLFLLIGEELKSWILPNNIPSGMKEIKIAIENQSPKKPILDPECKEILEDAYGKGKTKLWDKGDFSILTQWKTKLILNVEGKEFKGTYLLHIPNWGTWTRKKLWTIEKIR